MAQGNNRHNINEMDRDAAAWVIHDHAVDRENIRSGNARTTPTDHTSSTDWAQTSSDHRDAYDSASKLWDELALLDPNQLRQSPTAANDTGLGFFHYGVRIAAFAAIVLIAVIGGLKAPDLLLRSFADHSTGRGEITTITLADGSRVMLDAASAIDVQFSETARTVKLISGRASFDVASASDTVPPFVVRAGQSATRALGTKFDVEYMPDDDGDVLSITAIEHQIELTPNVEHRQETLILSPGEQVTLGKHEVDSTVRQVNLATSTSWQSGFLVFDHAKLSDVTRTLSRYAEGPIVVASADLANREVSGMFRIDKIDQAVDFISEGLKASSYSIPHVATFLID
ncbi:MULTISPECIES: FecR family protein [Thalassospira]|uniref:FecR domain-containing protein n=1 Tax=Thalassospira aquimaris TaxID=3037796 RepID=A0ABT6GH61_9PROT|nr:MULTISPECIES: FecR domain-containing protein [Thalassospira]MDG4721420.1 FecR domain-containing protein [Thalassospira sp. FZY0004]